MTAPGWQTVQVPPLSVEARETVASAVAILRHDVANALVAAIGGLELEAVDAADASQAERLTAIRASLVRPYDYLRRAAGALPLADVSDVLWQSRLVALANRVAASGVTLDLGPGVEAACAQTPSLIWVVEILVANALDALTPPAPQTGQQVRVQVTPATGAGKPASLLVEDNGPGCADLARIAGRSLRRPAGGHLGLGLAVAASVLAETGGKLTVSSAPGRGFVAQATWNAVA